jgi:hypothetical protein
MNVTLHFSSSDASVLSHVRQVVVDSDKSLVLVQEDGGTVSCPAGSTPSSPPSRRSADRLATARSAATP